MTRVQARGAVFFDRDGVLNEEVGYASRPDQIRWTPTAKAAVRRVNAAGLYAFVVTNQSGVGRGYYSEAELTALHDWMAGELAAAGARIDAFTFCPHHPDSAEGNYRRECRRRKPGPGMILDLMTEYAVDPGASFMVGDRDTDLAAAAAAGIPALQFTGGDLDQLVCEGLRRYALA